MENRISSQQVAFLAFLLMLGSAFVFVPEATAGRNAWVSSILAALIGFYALAVILRLQLMFPGVSIFKIAELSLGLVPGKILNMVYLFIVWVVAILYLGDIIYLLRQLFPLLPAFSLRTILILTAAYCLYKGITSIAYLAELVIGFILFFLVIGFLTPLSLADFSNLQPILSEWYAMAGATLYGAAWPYLGITVFALLLPLVNDLEKGYPKIVTWFIIAAVVLVFRTVLVLAVLGPELTLAYAFPFYKVFRLVEVQNFQRIELFFFAMWFTTSFIAGLVFYLGVVLGLKELFGLKDYRSLILPVGLLILTMSIYTIRSHMYFDRVLSTNAPFITVPGNLLYPTIVLLAALIAYNKVRDKLAPPSNATEQSMEIQE
jgi:spore germination protein KB